MISIVHTKVKEATKVLERVVSFNSRNQRVVYDKLGKELN